MYSTVRTSIGAVRITEEDGIITALYPTDEPITDGSAPAKEAAAQLEEYLSGKRTSFDLPYKAKGSPFQEKVWKELERIPYGETRSYRQIACAIGNPNACRAVGGAIHRNPILIFIPCHRVIGADGSLTGFGAGIPLKKRLLDLERSNKEC